MPVASVVALAFALLVSPLSHAPIADSAPSAKCAAPEFHQFDFALGDWDTYDMDAPTKLIARNHVTRMVDGCALREVYEQNDGLHGESISAYDASRGRWHQSWVTNRGSLLLFDARFDGNSMIFTAPEKQRDGSTATMRVRWWREGLTLRERAERSRDDGATWTPLFDIVFRPHDARNGA